MISRLFLSNSNCEDDFIIVYLNPRKNIWVDTENACDGFELTEESWETLKQFIESLFKYKNSYQFKEDEYGEYLYRIREPLTEEEIEEVIIENARQEEWLKEKKGERKKEEDENDDDEN